MIRNVNLIEYLPLYMQEYREIMQIMNTENPEFQIAADESEVIKNNQFIETCNLQGIAKFEKLLKINPSSDDTLESRISRVITRWNDVVPYTYKAFIQKLMILCNGINFTIDPKYNEYKMEVITHLELPGQVDELQFLLGFMIPSNLEITSKNDIYCESSTNSYFAAGMLLCNRFELSDAYNEQLNIQGSSLLGGGMIGSVQVSISDNYNETITVSGAENVGSKLTYAETIGIKQ